MIVQEDCIVPIGIVVVGTTVETVRKNRPSRHNEFG